MMRVIFQIITGKNILLKYLSKIYYFMVFFLSPLITYFIYIYICHFLFVCLFVGLFANLQGKWPQKLQELEI